MIKRFLIPFFIFAFGHCFSQSYDQQFDINNPFAMTLTVGFDAFIEHLESDEYMTARIKYYLDDVKLVDKKVKIKTRGVYRRSNCVLPPMKISFNAKDYEVDVFNKLGKVKLVNACMLQPANEMYLIKEHLTYKSYELFTPFSFRTYFLKITFVDEAGKYDPFTSYSFLIEDIDDLAKRNNGEELETEELKHKHLDSRIENIMSIFQYMIGNTDWYLGDLHNLKLVQLEDPNRPKPVPIPYDFDFSGLVNADYANPDKRLKLENVRERYYLGECSSKEQYEQLFIYFLQKKKEIYNLFKKSRYLDDASKEDALEYLDSFFIIISDNIQAKRFITRKCK